MLDLQQVRIIRATVHLHNQGEIPHKLTPYDHDLHQECIDDAVRRGYPAEGDHPVRTSLRVGVAYVATIAVHIARPTQIWIALYTGCLTYADGIPIALKRSRTSICLPTDCFARRRQGNAVLDALGDVIHRALDLFQPIPAELIMTSSLNDFIASSLEYETESMQYRTAVSRRMTGLAEGFACLAFLRETPLTNYVQTIQEIMLFANDTNEVVSFYKEELAGEDVNQISIIAAGDKISHLEAFQPLSEIAVSHFNKIIKILEGPEACEAFKHSGAGCIDFQTASEGWQN